MCSNGFKTCSNVSNVFQPVQNLFKCVQMCSKLLKNYQIFQCMGSHMTSRAWSSFRVAHMMMTQSNLGDCWRNWNWFHQIRPQSQQLLNRQQSYWSESVTISSVWRIISHSLWNWYHYLLLSFLILFFITLRYIQPYILLPTFYLKFGPNGNSSLIILIGSFLFFLLLSFFSSC